MKKMFEMKELHLFDDYLLHNI